MVLSVSFRARSNDEVVVVVVARGKEKRRRKLKRREGRGRGIIEIILRECSERNIIGGLKYKMHNNRHKKKRDERGRDGGTMKIRIG